MKQYKAKKTGTLLEVLKDLFPERSMQSLRNLIKHSVVTCNGQPIQNPRQIINKEDILIFSDKPQIKIWKIGKKIIRVVYEDEWLLIVHKPAGMLTSGEATPKSPTLVKVIKEKLKSETGQPVYVGIVHRIDREVEGLVIFAKQKEVLDKLKNNWKNVEKNYLAITQFKPSVLEGEISSWLKDGPKQKVLSYSKEVPGSKWAVTWFRYIKPIANYHLLEISLDTGRKNQIRVHLSEIGCPVVGDWKYGADRTPVRQIRLLAWKLSFTHPVTGKKIEAEAKIPEHFFRISETEDEKYK